VEEAIRKAISAAQADYVEVRIEREQRTQLLFRKDRLENIESSSDLGGFVRCLKNGGWGIAVFNDLARLAEKVKEAARLALIAANRTGESVALAEVPAVREEIRVDLEHDFRTIPLQEKKEHIELYNRLLLSHGDKIISTNVRYTDSFREIVFGNSEGTFLVQEIPDVTLLLIAVARDGPTNIQQGFESIGEAGGFEIVLGREEEVRKIAQRAVDLLNAPSIKGGKYVVILDPQLAGTFIHEAFGHFCEADFLFKNERLARIMTPGTRFGEDGLNVVDEGYIPGLRGNTPYDDEGVARSKTYLVRDGVLNGLLHSRETAKKMGAIPTGNARAISYEHEPIVRMTNTYIEAGDRTFAEMIADVDRGLYAVKAYGGQTVFEQFTFSAAYGYEIVNGELGGLVKDIVLTGNLFETLRSIDRIGNDLVLRGGAGGCGKGGQFPLPVTTGSPHIRIQDVTVGGK
jgi:TldD protein